MERLKTCLGKRSYTGKGMAGGGGGGGWASGTSRTERGQCQVRVREKKRLKLLTREQGEKRIEGWPVELLLGDGDGANVILRYLSLKRRSKRPEGNGG